MDRKDFNTAKSLVILNTGDGKGKSTAAFGTMLRALAQNWSVAVLQFIKSEKWNTGEQAIAEKLGVEWHIGGKGFSWESKNLKDDEATAKASWKTAQHLIAEGKHQLVVLDEITYPINWGWIKEDDVVTTLTDRPEVVSVVLTGRDASKKIIKAADTVTEMKKVKHAFDVGIIAKKGLDY